MLIQRDPTTVAALMRQPIGERDKLDIRIDPTGIAVFAEVVTTVEQRIKTLSIVPSEQLSENI